MNDCAEVADELTPRTSSNLDRPFVCWATGAIAEMSAIGTVSRVPRQRCHSVFAPDGPRGGRGFQINYDYGR